MIEEKGYQELNRCSKSVLNAHVKNIKSKIISQLIQESEIKPSEIKSPLQN